MRTVRIPPKRAVSFPVDAGTEFAVVNPEGAQVADLAAVTREGDVPLSQAHTRDLAGTVRAGVGDSLYARDGTALLTVVADDCGANDLLYAPCTGWLLEPPAFEPEPSGCEEHLGAALAAAGAAVPDAVDTVNLFQAVAVSDAGDLSVRPSPAEPGDAVRLRAEAPAVVAVSACAARNPDSGINGETLTPIDVRVPPGVEVRGPVPAAP
ncbi:urea carboxylase-associated family protein [Halorussus sp. AFM4]|uniref:urea carboxylase-associated family protein n=1 Tax=Halorussus sp. AFM4 TaxID=3421651 RepID=UPI003EBF5D21